MYKVNFYEDNNSGVTTNLVPIPRSVDEQSIAGIRYWHVRTSGSHVTYSCDFAEVL